MVNFLLKTKHRVPQRKQSVSRSTSGFTLIEVLIMLAIIGLVGAIALSSIQAAKQRGRDARRIADLVKIKIALQFYLQDNGFLPGRIDAQNIPVSPQYTESSTRNPTDQTATGIAKCGSGLPTREWSPLGGNGNLQKLIPNYLPVLPKDPLNTPEQNGYCYIYKPNPDLKGACVWALLERSSNNKVGIAVGRQDATLMGDGGKPVGFECNFLDEVIGGWDAALGSGGGGSPPAPPSSYILNVAVSGNGNVAGTEPSFGINCGADCAETYGSETTVTIIATPEGGESFIRWTGDCSGSDLSCTVLVNEIKSVTAEFTSVGGGTGSGGSGGSGGTGASGGSGS